VRQRRDQARFDAGRGQQRFEIVAHDVIAMRFRGRGGRIGREWRDRRA
jgi:hypothetical protein